MIDIDRYGSTSSVADPDDIFPDLIFQIVRIRILSDINFYRFVTAKFMSKKAGEPFCEQKR
jgi:hypothetical protein